MGKGSSGKPRAGRGCVKHKGAHATGGQQRVELSDDFPWFTRPCEIPAGLAMVRVPPAPTTADEERFERCFGFTITHVDFDFANNSIENLKLVPWPEHVRRLREHFSSTQCKLPKRVIAQFEKDWLSEVFQEGGEDDCLVDRGCTTVRRHYQFCDAKMGISAERNILCCSLGDDCAALFYKEKWMYAFIDGKRVGASDHGRVETEDGVRTRGHREGENRTVEIAGTWRYVHNVICSVWNATPDESGVYVAHELPHGVMRRGIPAPRDPAPAPAQVGANSTRESNKIK